MRDEHLPIGYFADRGVRAATSGAQWKNVATGQNLATPEGWVAFTPDGHYKYGGNIAGSFWHVAGLCRFEPGELDEYLHLRLPDDALFLPAKQ